MDEEKLMAMNNTLVLHVGSAKTGTTSIQSTLFWHPPEKLFRFVSLDTVFGNQLMLTAFSRQPRHQNRYFSETMSQRQKRKMYEFSPRYLSKSLQDCARKGLTPVISAEVLWGFEREDLQAIADFARRFGFEIRVVGYVRPPVDFLESIYQQGIKVGRVKHLEFVIERSLSTLSRWKNFDTIFGKANVDLYLFDRNRFPNGCVVQHFCQSIGLDLGKAFVKRENESINENILRFIYAWNTQHQKNRHAYLIRFRRRVLLESLRSLPGNAVRVANEIVFEIQEKAHDALRELENRIGTTGSLNTHESDRIEGLRSDDDMWRFSKDSLDWLFGRRGYDATELSTVELNTKVLRKLDTLSYLPNISALTKTLREQSNVIWYRNKLLKRWMSQTA